MTRGRNAFSYYSRSPHYPPVTSSRGGGCKDTRAPGAHVTAYWKDRRADSRPARIRNGGAAVGPAAPMVLGGCMDNGLYKQLDDRAVVQLTITCTLPTTDIHRVERSVPSDELPHHLTLFCVPSRGDIVSRKSISVATNFLDSRKNLNVDGANHSEFARSHGGHTSAASEPPRGREQPAPGTTYPASGIPAHSEVDSLLTVVAHHPAVAGVGQRDHGTRPGHFEWGAPGGEREGE